MMELSNMPSIFMPTELIRGGLRDGGLRHRDLNVYMHVLIQRDEKIEKSNYKIGVRANFTVNVTEIAEQMDTTFSKVLNALYRLGDSGWLEVKDASERTEVNVRFAKKIPPIWKPAKAPAKKH